MTMRTDLASDPAFRDAESAKRWLTERGGPRDQEAADLAGPADFLIAARLSRLDGLLTLGRAVRDNRAFRRAGTGRRRLGTWDVDSGRLLFRQSVLRPLALRLFLPGLVAAAGALLGLPLAQILLCMGAALLARWHTLACTLLALAAVVVGRHTWWFPPLATMTSW